MKKNTTGSKNRSFNTFKQQNTIQDIRLILESMMPHNPSRYMASYFIVNTFKAEKMKNKVFSVYIIYFKVLHFFSFPNQLSS
jgi:hypothetical protein